MIKSNGMAIFMRRCGGIIQQVVELKIAGIAIALLAVVLTCYPSKKNGATSNKNK